MKIKEQTRKLAAGLLKTLLWMELTKVAQNTVLRLWIELPESVSYTYGKVALTVV
ncbi:hypothetical protein [Streptococcus pneumoniae]|uniref:hypothetical protein n=1 Tax=Streptococcus pneumoniae TaxID=1313 RepID=UPI0015DB47E9|nr:hypothetical protein [Streptococcus pneumoniae]